MAGANDLRGEVLDPIPPQLLPTTTGGRSVLLGNLLQLPKAYVWLRRLSQQ